MLRKPKNTSQGTLYPPTHHLASSRITKIQAELTERCIELLNLRPEAGPAFLLDIGSGSGLSGAIITSQGHRFIGLDISPQMLAVARKRDPSSEHIQVDMGQGFSFKPGVFDGAISVSALQWLCVAAKKSYRPYKRLLRFFSSLYSCLGNSARAVFQFYPIDSKQTEMITSAAMKSGFGVGLMVDNPNSGKNRHTFLILTVSHEGDLEVVPTSAQSQNPMTGEGGA